MGTSDRLIWADVETFGLDHQRDQLIEVALVSTSVAYPFEPIDLCVVRIWTPQHEAAYEEHALPGNRDGFIFQTHTKSGLFEDARRDGTSYEDAQDRLLGFMIRNHVDDRPPICGSSVHLDRNFLERRMPELMQYFGYRNIDISSVKELVRRYRPEVYARTKQAWDKKNAVHRALDDVSDTIAEYSAYHRVMFP